MRDQITAIVNQGASVSHLFAFDAIPKRRLTRAQRNFANTGTEPIILLYDGSAFGTGGAGFVLTPTRLFYKDIVGQGVGNVADIVNITFDVNASPEPSLQVQTAHGGFPIGVWNMAGSQGADVLRTLRAVIGVLTGRPLAPDAPLAASAPAAQEQRIIECRGCGARYLGTTAACDYCGSPV